ncbi:hypothetical protein [Desulfovibrio sp. TomC]|uniref:hypothetical protein n=1 Tax=Desulfovibrio sp. TomC TaxID=1562888 RepID=UPI0012E245E3|nr:hypothetical protein [Desulfovibrio sp. TomC]
MSNLPVFLEKHNALAGGAKFGLASSHGRSRSPRPNAKAGRVPVRDHVRDIWALSMILAHEFLKTGWESGSRMAEDLRRHAVSQLPDFMVPAAIVFHVYVFAWLSSLIEPDLPNCIVRY